MILADSNLVIYAATGNYPNLINWFAESTPVVSAVSLVEVLGYHKLNAKEKDALENLFSQLTIIYPSVGVFQIAIELRQQHNLSLGDALIAATALQLSATLATHNMKDFDGVKSLPVIDPLSEK